MNVSAELIESLSSQLTPEQFKAFKYAVKLENSPQAAILDKWSGSAEWEDFMAALVDKEDECGFVTNQSVIEILDAEPALLYACYTEVNGDSQYLVGSKSDLDAYCEEHETRMNPCPLEEKNFQAFYGDVRYDIVRNLTQYMVKLGMFNRSEYVKDCKGGTRRCYKIVK